MKKCIFLLLLVLSFNCFSQERGANPPTSLTVYPDPPPLETAENSLFTAEVKLDGALNYEDTLFSYKTYVRRYELEMPTIQEDFFASSFVQFDFSGTVNMKITYNGTLPLTSAVIKPLSKNITPTISGNTITFSINNTDPSKSPYNNLSLEVNGNRYENLNIFASPPVVPPSPGEIYTNATDINNQLSTRTGRCGTLPTAKKEKFYMAGDNEKIYIKGGEVVNGSIVVDNKSGVKIWGRGVINILNASPTEKNYGPEDTQIPDNYCYLKGVEIRNGSEHIDVEGIIINDSEHYNVMISTSDSVTVKNVKMFSRVRWGDGINITASNGVTMEGNYIRSSDDAIAVLATRKTNLPFELGGSSGITATDCVLYPGFSRPIEIGFFGSNDINTRDVIENLHFEDIDILDVKSTNGALSINCEENNKCKDITFKDIRIEHFREGRLFMFKVEPNDDPNGNDPDGYRVENITVDNIASARGDTEYFSLAKGIDCEKYVNGVHFNNIFVNNTLLTNFTDYQVPNGAGFQITDNAKDITLNSLPVYVDDLNNGSGPKTYRIKNVDDGKSLHTSSQTDAASGGNYTITANWNNWNTQKWEIEYFQSGEYYTIKNPTTNKYLTASVVEYANNCLGQYTFSQTLDNSARQHWKILDAGNGKYRFKNVETEGSLQKSVEVYSSLGNYCISIPWLDENVKKWELIEITPSPVGFAVDQDSTNYLDEIFPYPNTSNNQFQLDFSNYGDSTFDIVIYDHYGNVILSETAQNELKTMDTSLLIEGLYILHISDGQQTIRKHLVINH